MPTFPEMSHHHATPRSFVLRQGRVSNAQRRAYETLLSNYGVPFKENMLEIVMNKWQI